MINISDIQIGDKLRVRQKSAMERVGISVGQHVGQNCGEILTVKKINQHSVSLKEQDGHWLLELFEGHAFEYGEEIKVSDCGEEWVKSIYVGYVDGSKGPYQVVVGIHEEKFKMGGDYDRCGYKYARPIRKQETTEIIVVDKKINVPKDKLKRFLEEVS